RTGGAGVGQVHALAPPGGGGVAAEEPPGKVLGPDVADVGPVAADVHDGGAGWIGHHREVDGALAAGVRVGHVHGRPGGPGVGGAEQAGQAAGVDDGGVHVVVAA